jgi:hypothetical protein
MKHLENKGNALLHSMEHTNTSDIYRLLFDETNPDQVDTLLATIDESLMHWETGTMQMQISNSIVIKE